MGIDANGYCTQCRTYRGVPQAPQQPTSGTPYSGAPYGGQQQPYAGYPASSIPSYSDPVSAPPTAYGATYGAAPSAPSRNKFLVPVLALSGVLVLLVVAIVVVAALKNGGDNKNTPVAGPTNGPTATDKPSTKPSAAIDECLVGTWTTKSYTEQMVVEGVGNVPVTLQKNGSTIKFTPDGKMTETYNNATFTGTASAQGASVSFTITVNASASAGVATVNGSLTYSNVQSSGTMNFKAPAANIDENEPFEATDDPAKYTCAGNTLTITTPQISQTADKSSSSY
ncbi:hypothetical protein [Dactylosporangium sp. CA-092794]|uniref:hypothetical protein n=1 Tax=Dactylosporangium sp. CA-092794 TaxID=3239929 RepID=UPI003D928A55